MRPLVYVAHPMTTYGTKAERETLERLAEIFPDVELVNPAVRYRNAAEWLADWPRLVQSLAAVAVFTEPDGTVGAGCIRELADAWAQAIPVALLSADGLREIRSVRVLPTSRRTPARTALVVGGRPVNLASVQSRAPAGTSA